MTPPKRSSRTKPPLRPPPEENGVVQLKVWLLGISPMIWRRLLVPSACTLRERPSPPSPILFPSNRGDPIALWRPAPTCRR
jgi:hypothetical protein